MVMLMLSDTGRCSKMASRRPDVAQKRKQDPSWMMLMKPVRAAELRSRTRQHVHHYAVVGCDVRPLAHRGTDADEPFANLPPLLQNTLELRNAPLATLRHSHLYSHTPESV